jgi:hypothetical protein
MTARFARGLVNVRSMYRVLGLVCVALTGVAHAEEEVAEEQKLHLHGFVSQGFLKSTKNNFLAESKDGSFEFFEAGLNVQRTLNDQLRMGVQLFSRDLGPNGDYKVLVDWAYLDYRWRNWLGLRAGRIKIPFGLYNDTSDIDAAHAPALLPQAVYPAENRNFLLAQTGGELYGYRELGKAGALDYRLYGGTVFLDLPRPQAGSPISVVGLTIPYLVGARVLWETPLEGLKVGVSAQRLRLETDIFDTRDPMMPARIEADIPATLAMASIEYTVDDFVFAAEYARWFLSIESSDPMAVPEIEQTNERAYVLASYRVTPRIQPSAYYGLFYVDAGTTIGRASKQHDAAAALRIDLTQNWLLKLEAHHMRGTASLSSALNDNLPLEQLKNNWLLFVVKTTAYF